nr:GspH/FimT family pseudopilin [Brevundimonas diminuta]
MAASSTSGPSAPTVRKGARGMTPTSATGRADRARSMRALQCAQAASRRAASGSARQFAQAARARGARGSEQRTGFTLVELMVVIAIIGVAAGAVVLSMPDPRPTLAVEAERFAARLTLAREEAVMTNRPVALRADAAGYGFESFDGAVWTPLTGVLAPKAWGEGAAVAGAARAVFDPTGGADAASVRLEREGQAVTVAIDGAGEVTIHE